MTGSSLSAAQLMYSLMADDVRLEMGNKLSVMGIFQNIFLHSLPATMLKFVVVNHWIGNGEHSTQIKILNPGRAKIVAATEPSVFAVTAGGFADNITVFANVLFEEEGPHVFQLFLDNVLVCENFLNVVVPTQQNPSVN